MTSLPIVVLRRRQIGRLIVFLMNLTLPSQKSVFTPPGCRLRAPYVVPTVAV